MKNGVTCYGGDMTELKPCPFCGASKEYIQEFDIRLFVTTPINGLVCKKCGGAIINGDIKKSSWVDLTKAWNRRASKREVENADR